MLAADWRMPPEAPGAGSRRLKPFSTIMVFLAAVAATAPAAAQFQWRDGAGRMVYSDRPPPPEVPQSRIVRMRDEPDAATTRLAGQAGAAAASKLADGGSDAKPHVDAARTGLGGAGATPAPPRDYRDVELAFRKRRAEREAAEHKAQEASASAQKRTAACARLNADLRALESGIRISEVGADGAQQVVSDGERGRRTAATRAALAEQCKAS